jgi:hypothetical protein
MPAGAVIVLFILPRAVWWLFRLTGHPIGLPGMIGLSLIGGLLVLAFWGSGWSSTPPATR